MDWIKQDDQSYKATDKDGNRFKMTANQETVFVRTKDGFTGCGWTAQDALAQAHQCRDEVFARHDKVLEECIAAR